MTKGTLFGDLGDFSFADLLERIGGNRRTGVLLIDEGRYTIHFLEGRIVNVLEEDSSDDRESVALLMRSGIVGDATMLKYCRENRLDSKPILDRMRAARLFSSSVRWKILEAGAIFRLFRVASVGSGAFSFMEKDAEEQESGINFPDFSVFNSRAELIRRIFFSDEPKKRLFAPLSRVPSDGPFFKGKTVFQAFIHSDLDFFSLLDQGAEFYRSGEVVFGEKSSLGLLLLKGFFRGVVICFLLIFLVFMLSMRGRHRIEEDEIKRYRIERYRSFIKRLNISDERSGDYGELRLSGKKLN